MKNKILMSLVLLLLSNQSAQAIDFNIYKWLYLFSLPVICGHMAVKARIESARQLKIELNKPNGTDLQVKINTPEVKKSETEMHAEKQHELAIKFKEIVNQKCILCETVKNIMYFTLLTYGSSANLIQRVFEKDPGSVVDITVKPILNAGLMYLVSYIMDKRVRDELLYN